jgi:hypothetical protein
VDLELGTNVSEELHHNPEDYDGKEKTKSETRTSEKI